MKKIIFLICLFFGCSIVNAEKFTIGEYVSGEYVRMVSPEKTKNLNVQIIRDSNNNFVYCLEPFILVDENKEEYDVYSGDMSGYKNLTAEQLRKISLIAFYGWGYKDRLPEKWYAITQMLIWKTVNPDDEFYFTDTKGGNVIDKYTGSMNQILSDVYKHDAEPTFVKDYIVNYEESLYIDNYTTSYDIVSSDYDYKYESSQSRLVIDSVVKDGVISFERDQFTYYRDVVIFSSSNSQDLIRPGKVVNKIYDINVKVTKSNLILDIRKDNTDVYTVESDFDNVCYEITRDEVFIDKVCANGIGFVYLSKELPYGEYIIKQVSTGKGYVPDNNIYKVILNGIDNNNLLLRNKLVQNRIELTKYYCYNDNCLKEENAVFNVYDNKEKLVGIITTNDEGYGYLDVGYGIYTIVQDKGLDNYTFVDVYEQRIISNEERYYKELYNYFIEENTSGFDNAKDDENNVLEEPEKEMIIEPEIEEKQEEYEEIIIDDIVSEETFKDDIKEELIQENKEMEGVIDGETIEELIPPVTGSNLSGVIKVLYNVIMIIICCCKLKKFCYNN